MGLKKKCVIWLLLLSLLLSVLLIGCSNSKTVSASAEAKLELAIKYLSEQKYEQAVLAYQEAIKIDSKNVIAYKGLSLAYALQEKPGEAEKALQDGLKILSNNEQLQLAMAGLMLDQDKGDQAEAIYTELTNANNPSLSSYQAYTCYLSQQGKQAEAIALLERAAGKNSNDYRLNSMLAELYFKSGDKEKALAAINKSLKAEPNQSSAYKQLAELYKDKWDELIALGDQYIQQNQPKTGQLLKLSGLLGMGKYDDVIKLFSELTTDLKGNPRVRFIAAQAYNKLGKKDQSAELMKPIKIADIKDAGMLAELAKFYLEKGDKENARKLAMLGISADETEIENYVVMFKSYEGQNKNLAQIWAYKYMIASSLSYKGSLSKLAEYEISDGFQKQLEGEMTSKDIVEAIIKDQACAEKVSERFIKSGQGPLTGGTIYCYGIYLDKKGNIAYEGYCEYESNWKPIIVRHHSPMFYTIEQIPTKIISIMSENNEWSHILSESKTYPKFLILHKNNWIAPLMFEGDIPFEEHLKRAGYPIENITFVDM